MSNFPSKRKQQRYDAALANRRQKELAAIHIKKKELIDAGRLTEDGYRAAVAGILNRLSLPSTRPLPSAADLNPRGRTDLLKALDALSGNAPRPAARRRAEQPPAEYHGAGTPGEAGHLTQRQAEYMAHLEHQLGWTGQPERLLGFIQKQTGKRTAPSMLRNREATKVITGLERLVGKKPHPYSKAKGRS